MNAQFAESITATWKEISTHHYEENRTDCIWRSVIPGNRPRWICTVHSLPSITWSTWSQMALDPQKWHTCKTCEDKFFFREAVNGAVTLKINHNYFCRVQRQMSVSERKWRDLLFERIKFDEQLWKRMITKLKTFHTEKGVAKIFSERVKKWKSLFWSELHWLHSQPHKRKAFHTKQEIVNCVTLMDIILYDLWILNVSFWGLWY